MLPNRLRPFISLNFHFSEELEGDLDLLGNARRLQKKLRPPSLSLPLDQGLSLLYTATLDCLSMEGEEEGDRQQCDQMSPLFGDVSILLKEAPIWSHWVPTGTKKCENEKREKKKEREKVRSKMQSSQGFEDGFPVCTSYTEV